MFNAPVPKLIYIGDEFNQVAICFHPGDRKARTYTYSWGIVEEKFQIELNHYFKFNIDSKVFLEV